MKPFEARRNVGFISDTSKPFLIPIPDLQSPPRADPPALSRRPAKTRRIVRQDFEPSRTPQHQATSIGRLYVRIHAYLTKVHRTSGARTGFSRPIIKMHARYVTTLCTYVPKYYPAPVPVLSLFLSPRISYRIRGVPNLSRFRSSKNRSTNY